MKKVKGFGKEYKFKMEKETCRGWRGIRRFKYIPKGHKKSIRELDSRTKCRGFIYVFVKKGRPVYVGKTIGLTLRLGTHGEIKRWVKPDYFYVYPIVDKDMDGYRSTVCPILKKKEKQLIDYLDPEFNIKR